MPAPVPPEVRERRRRRGALMASIRGDDPQSVWAERADVHQTTWSGYERGAHDMSIEHALRIADVLGVTVGELLAGERISGAEAVR